MKARFLWIALAAALGACDDNTATLGILEENDQITSSYSQFQMKTTTPVPYTPLTLPTSDLG